MSNTITSIIYVCRALDTTYLQSIALFGVFRISSGPALRWVVCPKIVWWWWPCFRVFWSFGLLIWCGRLIWFLGRLNWLGVQHVYQSRQSSLYELVNWENRKGFVFDEFFWPYAPLIEEALFTPIEHIGWWLVEPPSFLNPGNRQRQWLRLQQR